MVVQFALLGLIFWLPEWVIVKLFPSVFASSLKYAGYALLIWAGISLGRNLTPLPKPKTDAQLVTTGVFAWMRHPIYSALMLISFGSSLERGNLIAFALSLCLTILLEFKSRREEAWLCEQFSGYAAYRLRVKKFIPGLY